MRDDSAEIVSLMERRLQRVQGTARHERQLLQDLGSQDRARLTRYVEHIDKEADALRQERPTSRLWPWILAVVWLTALSAGIGVAVIAFGTMQPETRGPSMVDQHPTRNVP